jgi:hypothetical protein
MAILPCERSILLEAMRFESAVETFFAASMFLSPSPSSEYLAVVVFLPYAAKVSTALSNSIVLK